MTENSAEAPSRIHKWLREPFIHFLILGAVLFAGHALWQRGQDYQANTIIVDPEEMERRAILFAGENQRNPTEEELQALLYDYVQEEALVREADRLGLDAGDTIVRRRLAQKARFMIEDTADLDAPDEETLCAYMADNPQKFAEPPRRSFAHIYIAPGELSDAALRSKADALKAQAETGDWAKLGDPFMLNRTYRLASYPDVAKSFGPQFAQSLFELDAKSAAFQGPVESAFGLHLVRVDKAEEQSLQECAAIITQVEEEWRRDQREKANAASVRAIVDQYEVVVAE